jgi:hypothetical protein
MKLNNYLIKLLTERELLKQYTLSLGAIGYEARARYAFSKLGKLSKTNLALRFNDRQVHDFHKNDAFFNDMGFTLINAATECFRQEFRKMLSTIAKESPKGKISCIVDISSITRAHIAIICYEWFVASRVISRDILVDFVYSYAKYSEPPVEFGPIKVRGPVIPELCGWNGELEIPTSLIIGIGYEKDMALGITEELEPSDLVVFRPMRHEKRYSEAIDRLNKVFLESIPPDRIVNYNVYDIFSLYTKLCNAISGLVHDTRPTLVPMGPKIFSLCCVLSGLEWLHSVSVWRVSAAEFGDPINRVPNGDLGFLRMELQNSGDG